MDGCRATAWVNHDCPARPVLAGVQDVLHARDRALGGTVMFSLALQLWQRVRLALKDGTAAETGCQFLAVAGELTLCPGWIALDGGRMPPTRPLHDEARPLTSRSGAGTAERGRPAR